MLDLCCIVGAYCPTPPVLDPTLISYLIAADGGYEVLLRCGVTPHAVIGDFDSLGYRPQHAHTEVFPCEKDDTDLALAVRHGFSQGYTRFLLYGGLGGRLDHTVANLTLLAHIAERGGRGWLCDGKTVCCAIHNGSLTFDASLSGTLSVFCMGRDAHGVTLQGLKYPLCDATLTASVALGVSNEFLHTAATVTVRDGTLLLIWEQDPNELLQKMCASDTKQTQPT